MTTEADTCRRYVLPKLYAAGWNDDQISERQTFTDGRIVVIGTKISRRPQKRADYLLRYRLPLMIAVVEAKASYKKPGDGLQQVGLRGATGSHNLVMKDVGGGDLSWNYDFQDQSYAIDWPVTLIFCGPNATVENIKSHYWGSASANTCWGRFYDVGYWEWMWDTGTKSRGITMCHMRLYGHANPDGHYCYNSQLGKYVIATTHYDRWERWPWHKVGWSEDSANEVISKRPSGWWLESESTPYYDWHNYEGGYWVDNRYYQCDGIITLIHTAQP
jgi:hypothetical protein